MMGRRIETKMQDWERDAAARAPLKRLDPRHVCKSITQGMNRRERRAERIGVRLAQVD
jgi:hypothetical protein